MVEAVVVSQVLAKLGELVEQEAIFLFGVREKFEWLETELNWIKSFLRDAAAKRKEDERVRNWMHEVIDVCYQAEDAIDSFLLLIQHKQLPCFLDCITSITPCQLMERHRIGVEIDRIKDSINEIKSRREAYGIQSLEEDTESANIYPCSRSQAEKVVMVGLHDVHEEISKQLIDKQKQQLCFRCIYGTGGLGKTTLARKIFQSNDVRRNFSLRIWMVVTQFSGSVELLAKIIKDVTSEEITNLEGMEVENFTEKMKESLGEQKRCLIVLDDVWEEHKYVCGLVQRLFASVMNGSRVLVTTRFKKIAMQTDTSTCPCQLRFLNEDESVELLLKKAYPNQDVEKSCPKELVDLAPLLAKKCWGLPLALSVVGGLLAVKEKTPHVWMNLAEEIDWASQGKECQDILALGYDDLKYYIPCFLYFAMFPQDYVIPASLIVKLWVAEGLVEDEDSGDVVLEELIQRNLVQLNQRRPDGRVQMCSVHDLLLELAKDEAKNNGFVRVCSSEHDIRAISGNRHTRRVAFQGAKTTNKIEGQTVLPGLRTMMQFHSNVNRGTSLLFRSELLRVIELRNVALPSRLPEEIMSMKHLRYLGLRRTGVKELPTSIGELQNLQTIDLRDCKPSIIIPSTLFKIKTLRHVQTDGTLRPPPNLVLHDIRTLGKVGTTWISEWMFPKLKKFCLVEVDRFPVTSLVTVLADLEDLEVLKIEGRWIPIEVNLIAFKFYHYLGSLSLNGKWLRRCDDVS